MLAVDLNKLELLEAWSEQDPNARMKEVGCSSS